ncbi:MAG: DUF2625 family protein, partial [Sphingobacteriales bacterium]
MKGWWRADVQLIDDFILIPFFSVISKKQITSNRKIVDDFISFFMIRKIQPVVLIMVWILSQAMNLQAQNAVTRPIDTLVLGAEEGAARLNALVKGAKNNVEVLPPDQTRVRAVLYSSQVTARSTMGAVVYNTGGILIDSGWVRILGSGHERFKRDLGSWNAGKTSRGPGDVPRLYYIADDVTGGLFALNGGALGKNLGMVYYLPPDDLKWMTLDIGYTDFLNFCFNGNIKDFYQDVRWKDCRK